MEHLLRFGRMAALAEMLIGTALISFSLGGKHQFASSIVVD